MPDKNEEAVLAKLGQPSTHVNKAKAKVNKSQRVKAEESRGSRRERRAARQEEQLKAIEARQQADAQREAELGVVRDGQDDADIPRDDDGDPLWLYNPRTGRVVPNNSVWKEQPQDWMNKGLYPCGEPTAEIEEALRLQKEREAAAKAEAKANAQAAAAAIA